MRIPLVSVGRMIHFLPAYVVAIGALCLAACADDVQEKPLAHQAFIEITKDLSTDEMAGRAPGTPGSKKARAYLLQTIASMGFEPLTANLSAMPQANPYLQVFSRTRTNESGEVIELPDGVNILFAIPRSGNNARTIVVTAHYDHLGVIDGKVFNGADDNASGVAGLLAIAQHFQEFPPENTIVFALVDAEEGGLDGARAFVREFGDTLEIALNINLDMISRSDVNELYVAGTYHQPHWVPFIEDLARRVPVTLLMGYDDPAAGRANDWTFQSDHFAFHEQGIPFLYFGVEDHPDYHQPSDDFEKIPQAFFSDSIETVRIAAESIDAELDAFLNAGD